MPGLRELNKQRRVDQILAAARELLREEPGSAPGMERIAARADVAPATVFNLVGTRERVWAALGDEMMAEVERRVASDAPADPHERARWIAAETARVICEDADVFRAVLSNWQQSGRLMRRSPIAAIAECLGDRALAELVGTGCTGAAHQWAAGLLDDEHFAQRCAEFVDLAFDRRLATSAVPAARARA